MRLDYRVLFRSTTKKYALEAAGKEARNPVRPAGGGSLCRETVMSNQKPNSCFEFQHTSRSVKNHGDQAGRRVRRLPCLP